MSETLEARPKRVARHVLSVAMMTVGVLHFVNPTPFVRIVPSALPAPLFLVYLSGAIEISLGLALALRRTRTMAAWGLVALFVAVFPANINMAVNHIALDPANPTAEWVAWVRLPLQLALIAWAWWVRK